MAKVRANKVAPRKTSVGLGLSKDSLTKCGSYLRQTWYMPFVWSLTFYLYWIIRDIVVWHKPLSKMNLLNLAGSILSIAFILAAAQIRRGIQVVSVFAVAQIRRGVQKAAPTAIQIKRHVLRASVLGMVQAKKWIQRVPAFSTVQIKNGVQRTSVIALAQIRKGSQKTSTFATDHIRKGIQRASSLSSTHIGKGAQKTSTLSAPLLRETGQMQSPEQRKQRKQRTQPLSPSASEPSCKLDHSGKSSKCEEIPEECLICENLIHCKKAISAVCSLSKDPSEPKLLA